MSVRQTWCVDRLTAGSVAYIVRSRRLIGRVLLLDGLTASAGFWRLLLRLLGVPCEAGVFFAGHLRTPDGEAVYFAARRLANELAFGAATGLLHQPAMRRAVPDIHRATLTLVVAKHLARHIEEWTARILVAHSLLGTSEGRILLRHPRRFDATVLDAAAAGRCLFYPDPVRDWKTFLTETAFAVARQVVRDGHGHFTYRSPASSSPLPSGGTLLMIQEESLRNSPDLRNQLHFIDRVSGPHLPVVVVKAHTSAQFDDETLTLPTVTVLPYAALGRARQAFLRNPVIARLRRWRRRLAVAAIHPGRAFAERYFLVQVWFLLFQSELMAGISLERGVRCFASKETHNRTCDAVQIVARDLGVTTVTMQYSNTPFVSPVMTSTADEMLAFSEQYGAVFHVNGIGPARITGNGYIYGGIESAVSARAARHRAALADAGARFVIGYFDESVQLDQWGCISEDDHRRELHLLCQFLLERPDVGLLVKSQFMRNSPSSRHTADPLLAAALATRRYVEVRRGAHRNDVYPMEVGLAADICLGHKFGATAAMEVASAGRRAILIDTHGVRTAWDALYERAGVVFSALDEALQAIDDLRRDKPSAAGLGDWASIRAALDPPIPGTALARTRQRFASILAAQ
ncbi:MAG: hypothetical protein AMXMBFR57_16600 [Acidimicrobiia bacterium]